MPYPEKPALNNYPINELIKKRWSPRLFADQPIEPEKIMSLFEAARWAASSRNEQPWRFIYAHQEDQINFNRLSSLLTESNAWAQKAHVLIVILAKKNFTYDGKNNYNAMYDTGASAFSMFLEAVHQGLIAHEMIGFNQERAVTDLGFNSEEYKAGAMMAVGYAATEADLEKVDPKIKEKELAKRERLPLKEIIFKGKK